jgi:hypothetical protein
MQGEEQEPRLQQRPLATKQVAQQVSSCLLPHERQRLQQGEGARQDQARPQQQQDWQGPWQAHGRQQQR